VTYAGGASIKDAKNLALANTKPLESYDTAAPVPVFALGSVGTTSILVTWSEKIYSADDGVVGAFASSNTIFGYQNATVTTDGATALGTAAATVDITGARGLMTLTAGATLTLDDITNDKIWVNTDLRVYDNANGTAPGNYRAAAPYATNTLAGYSGTITGYDLNIDDTIMPYVASATTLDVNGDGYVDYIRIVMNENVDDSSITGYALNAMGTANSKWILSGYTGELQFNFFTGSGAAAATKLGREAAFTAEEALFTDNGIDDTILYVKIVSPMDIAGTTGLGNSGYRATLSWATPTITDMKPTNLLDEVTSAKVAVDAIGPVIMKAETKSTRVLQVTFSEDVDATTLDVGDFGWLVSNAGQTPEDQKSYANFTQTIDEISAGVVQLTVSPGAAWDASTLGKISLTNTVADLALNAAGTAAAANNGR